MDGVLLVAIGWTVALFAIALLLARFLRRADGLDERRRRVGIFPPVEPPVPGGTGVVAGGPSSTSGGNGAPGTGH